jgi:serine protease
MKKTLTVWIGLIGTIVLMSATFAGAAGHEGSPPFRNGQIVVAGAPGPHLDGFEVAKYLPNADLTVVKVERGKEFAMVQRFQNRGKKASLNYIAHATAVPNDFYYPLQWHFTAVQSEAAWDVSTGAGVVVAVLDTGIADIGNEDGVNICSTITPRDVVNGDDDPVDGDGHGTHVSGTIAQATNNSTGVAGLAYNACILPVKVLDDTGSGDFADIADGVHYAVANGANVINMSLGTNARYNVRNISYMDAELDYAYANNVTVVVSSGNDGSRKNVSYPAIYPTTIAVGATDYNNNVTRYSNKGVGLDLVAPGGDTTRDHNNDGYVDGVLQETVIDGSWNYYFFQGTSMASPHVAAVAALLVAADGSLTPDLVYQALTTTTVDLNETGYDKTSGYGLIQAYDALTGDEGGGTEPPPPSGIDADGDGWTVEDGDCDDNDSNVYPGHPDSRGRWGRDGVDNDCNGVIDG